MKEQNEYEDNTMFITTENKILIKELKLSKKWGVKKFVNEFRDKN